MRNRLIGISGKKHSGKTTLANNFACLLEDSSLKWTIVSFADAVKDICAKLEECDVLAYYDDKLKKEQTRFGLTRRQMMQTVGTDIAQHHKKLTAQTMTFDEIFNCISVSFNEYLSTSTFADYSENASTTVWVNYFHTQIYQKFPKFAYILADIRFEHDATYVNSANGLLIRLNGDPAKLNDNIGSDHISETALDAYDMFDAIIDTSDMSPEDNALIAMEILNEFKIS